MTGEEELRGSIPPSLSLNAQLSIGVSDGVSKLRKGIKMEDSWSTRAQVEAQV